jgi:polyhydroxyalkanoate synthase subunit PhaE
MMADSDSTANQWLEMQRRYWDAWMDMTRRGLEVANPKPGVPDNPWADAIEQWAKAVAPTTPKPASDLLEQMVNVGKGYFTMVESLYKAGPASDLPEMVENWTRMMSEAFSKGSANLNPFAQLASKSGGKGLAFWDLPFDTWSRTLSGSMPFPGDFMKAFETGKATDLRSQLEGFLSAPAIGYARESQEQYQQLGRLLLDYEKAMGEYQAGFAHLGMRSLDAFRTRMQEATKDGKTINSVREVFNVWVDACEEAYAEYAMSDDFAKRYGRMVNALMAVKHQGARLVDEWLETLNIPTSSEIATLQRRLHDTRADYHKLRCQVEVMQSELDESRGASGDLEDLRAQVAELRAALEKARTSSAAAAPEAQATPANSEGPPEKPKPAATRRKRTTTTDAKPATTRKAGATRRKTQ